MSSSPAVSITPPVQESQQSDSSNVSDSSGTSLGGFIVGDDVVVYNSSQSQAVSSLSTEEEEEEDAASAHSGCIEDPVVVVDGSQEDSRNSEEDVIDLTDSHVRKDSGGVFSHAAFDTRRELAETQQFVQRWQYANVAGFDGTILSALSRYAPTTYRWATLEDTFHFFCANVLASRIHGYGEEVSKHCFGHLPRAARAALEADVELAASRLLFLPAHLRNVVSCVLPDSTFTPSTGSSTVNRCRFCTGTCRQALQTTHPDVPLLWCCCTCEARLKLLRQLQGAVDSAQTRMEVAAINACVASATGLEAFLGTPVWEQELVRAWAVFSALLSKAADIYILAPTDTTEEAAGVDIALVTVGPSTAGRSQPPLKRHRWVSSDSE